MFYEFNQNNSYGRFDVNENVCHILFIEADTYEDAKDKAEELGCYWNGVDNGIDCPCCGDRWYDGDEVDIEKYATDGYAVSATNLQHWKEKCWKYNIIEKPKCIKRFSTTYYQGRISFKDIEEYAQYLANTDGWTAPDVRIFYKDGTIKEIFTEC